MDMRRASLVGIALLATLLVGWALAQRSVSRAGSSDAGKLPPVYLRTRIALPGVYGRMDRYGLDTKRGVLIVSALGNNTVELISNWKRIHTITGLEHPQGSLYIPGIDKIVVSSQSGKVRFYDAESYKLLKTLDFGDDADTDNLRYDPAAKRVYVGFGEDETGAIGVIDPATMEHREPTRPGILRDHRPQDRRCDQMEDSRHRQEPQPRVGRSGPPPLHSGACASRRTHGR